MRSSAIRQLPRERDPKKKRKALPLLACLSLLAVSIASAKPRLPLAETAYDGGVLSAETLGRGGAFAAAEGTFASGSENPAALLSVIQPALYTTLLVKTRSDLETTAVRRMDPLEGKTLQYIAFGGEKSVLFYEPLGRMTDVHAPHNTGGVEWSGDAIGFAGATRWRSGSMGMSLAYLRGSAMQENAPGEPATFDAAHGLRFGMGFQMPTGPAMWGLVIKNAPAYLWWKDFRRDMLPITVRVGNRLSMGEEWIFLVDGEKRFYREGGRTQDVLHLGAETRVSEMLTVRGGVFSDDIEKPAQRHWTGGVTFTSGGGASITVGWERFTAVERVQRLILSISAPFFTP